MGESQDELLVEGDVSPILEIAELTGQSEEELARHWARLFIQHDRLMLKTFQTWAGPERALHMHDQVWENPRQPLREIFLSMGPTAREALDAYARAFMIHDYFSLKALRDEIGDVDAIEAHHSLWEGQAEDYASVTGHQREAAEFLSWDDLYETYNAHTSREGLPYDLTEATGDRLVIESTHCAYFDTIVEEMGRDAAEEHLRLIAIESTDRTIEGFLLGIGQENEIRGVMTQHRCHGDGVCQIEFTRRDPGEALNVMGATDRPGTQCFFGSKSAAKGADGPR
ncbi:MAG: hypothetical protein BMS9Abin07_1215 [Acidimicrobiia bacterium]|nr:MAG: hypothetical protein BMS9Abin07_1215 [Acidimicrobiia bacterium]